ncbi:HNH endonuclease signature motif containing protein [Mycobacterium sp. pUA109]|uniref:HNH endonuclease signature motif containing protein n=1 Tax=Mycobacterium sp. pUA109 TaxID=3238982 RepID=UPI00351AD87F
MAHTDQVLLPAPAARAQIRADLDLIDAAQARLRAADTDLVGNAFRVQVAERLETQARVNRGLSYRMFGEIADPPEGFEDPALPADKKIRDLLWERLRLTKGEINRRFRIAARVRPRRNLTGPPLPPPLPAVAEAVEQGRLGDDHLAEITKALDRLPANTSPTDYTNAERTLVDYAGEQDANFVTEIGHYINDCLNPDGNFTDDDRARRRSLTLGRQGPDGMSRLTGCVDPETRAYLEAIFAAVRPGHHTPDPEDTGARDVRTRQQRDHDALKLALRHAIESGRLGTHRGVPVTVIAMAKLADLEQALRAMTDPSIPMPPPARTGGGSRLPMRDLIRMAANSVHYLAVFDNHSERPLYLGRSRRIATLDHRIICYARDRGCTRPNCTQRGYHCEVHHSDPWARGGRTDADKLYFACGDDHAGETNGHYTTIVTTDYRLAWTDGTTPPQINHIHHPEELLDNDSDKKDDAEDDP